MNTQQWYSMREKHQQAHKKKNFKILVNNQLSYKMYSTSDLLAWFVHQLWPGLSHHRELPAAGIPVGWGRSVPHSHHGTDCGVLQLEEGLGRCWRVAWDREWAGEVVGSRQAFARCSVLWLRMFGMAPPLQDQGLCKAFS